MKEFRDILVMPTQDLLNGVAQVGRPGRRGRRGIFRGGPVFPLYPLQIRARHCRGVIPIPQDRRPDVPDEPQHRAAAGVWCGPASPHFGHMIADFGMRIAEAAHRTDLPLVFSTGPASHPEPAPFFHDILRHLGVAPERVLLVRAPTRFDRLLVPAQAERLGGAGPSAAHLDLMDAAVARHPPPARDVGVLFVSRARLPDGRIAAESYLDAALTRAGATVMHPETLALPEQLALYRRAERIVFSEGSAAHALQLLGRLDTDIAVLVRRPGTRFARAHLKPRAKSLAYWDLTRHLIYGRTPGGGRQLTRALAVPDEAALIARFRTIGLDLAPHWDGEAYRAARDADLRHWIAYMRLWNLHPSVPDTIRRCLDAAGIEIGFEEAWADGAPSG